ncbi:MAG: AAA family ATPase [Sphingomicrobium sp.]
MSTKTTLVETASMRSRRVARARSLFKEIRVPHPRQTELHVALEELRLTATQSVGQPQGGVQLLAPWGSGKTVGAQLVEAAILREQGQDRNDRPMVIAKLSTAGTAKSIPSAILRALGEPRSDKGDEEVLWMRAREALKDARTRLLTIDETDRATRRPTISGAIASALRDLADEGICALAFLGTSKSESLFRNCQDLDERLDAPVTMEPLDFLIDEDKEIFSDLVRDFDEAMVDKKILRRPSQLAKGDTPRLLAEASNGILRQLARIIETAMISVVRRDGDAITRDDLADAVADWSIAKGLIDYNPFEMDRSANDGDLGSIEDVA